MPTGAHTKECATLQRRIIPIVAIAFLLAQLLMGFHHHSDPGQKRGDTHLPTAECTLCLAAHLPFDIAPAIDFAAPNSFPIGRFFPSTLDAQTAPVLIQHQPRAPPMTS